jgi:hypothetical protein
MKDNINTVSARCNLNIIPCVAAFLVVGAYYYNFKQEVKKYEYGISSPLQSNNDRQCHIPEQNVFSAYGRHRSDGGPLSYPAKPGIL